MNWSQRKWTDQEKTEANSLKAQGVHTKAIAKILGRSYGSVDSMFRHATIEYARKKRRQQLYKEYGVKLWYEKVHHIFVPPEVWEERNRRINEPRTAAQELMGDPPFSQCALSKR